MAIQKLPEDLLVEILSRLPVKLLLRSKSVCKCWYFLLQTPGFIYLQHDCAASIAAAKNTDYLLVKRFLDRGEGGVVLSFVPDETQVEDVDISSTGLDMKQLQILGPCNGVICLTQFALNSSSTKTIGARSANCFVQVAAIFLCEVVLVSNGSIFLVF